MNLVTAAIVYWNSIDKADAVAHLRAQGEIVPDEPCSRARRRRCNY
nr:Tn3 family transposase [Mesorhizobium loti]